MSAVTGPRTNVWPLPAEDERMIREHHLTDEGYERCVICRLLSTIDSVREDVARLEGLVMVYKPVYESVRDDPRAHRIVTAITEQS